MSNDTTIIQYCRESICAGDDAGCGIYRLDIPLSTQLSGFIQILCRGGYGNTWPIPTHYSNTYWMIQSNIGSLAYLIYDDDEVEYIEYPRYRPTQTVGELGIRDVYACRPIPYFGKIMHDNYREAVSKLRQASELLEPIQYPLTPNMTKCQPFGP